jgi:hypothetical protein
MLLFWHKLKKQLLYATVVLSNTAMFLGITLIGGLGSSWYMIEKGSALTTATHGPWTGWVSALKADADPYTKAHFARSGTLQMSSELGGQYIAQTDSNGGRLHSSCDYVISGIVTAADWWSLTVFSEKSGMLIANAANRHAYTRSTVAENPDGTYTVTLAREARPGNWLPTGGAGRLQVVYNIVQPDFTGITAEAASERRLFPDITKVQCR